MAKYKQNQKDITKPSPKDKMNQMALKVQAQDEVDVDDEEAIQFEAMVALEEAMKIEGDTYPTFVDEDSYGADVVIGGIELGAENALSLLTQLDKTAKPVTEEEIISAMKELRVSEDHSYLMLTNRLSSTRAALHISSNQQKDYSM